MATEYGFERNGKPIFSDHAGDPLTRTNAESICRTFGYAFLAREVSEPRIVSIRA